MNAAKAILQILAGVGDIVLPFELPIFYLVYSILILVWTQIKVNVGVFNKLNLKDYSK